MCPWLSHCTWLLQCPSVIKNGTITWSTKCPHNTQRCNTGAFFFLSLNLFQDLESVSWILASPQDWTSCESPNKKTKQKKNLPHKIVFSDRFNLNRHPPTLPVKNKTFPLLSRRRLRLCVSTFSRCYPSIEPRPNARAESLEKKAACPPEIQLQPPEPQSYKFN